ncbi:MAG: Fe-Mn family superoxide dismutase [Candidatus Gracilibacteria bacterium]|nr:Fe-Mn family superoxide dismutase [bacterium]MDZ4217113.1 Fe-Mn family superoxide dismutase [Candidatus Gracilibacteria bacterium]
MTHQAQDFSHLLGNLDGISDAQLEAHFGLYQGYVKKLNEIEEKLGTVDKSLVNYSFGEYSELKRRYVVPYNGTYLHQMYFENLAKDGGEMSDELRKAVIDSFGSVDVFLDELKASGTTVVGWVLTCKNKRDGRLQNHIVYEHHVGLPVDQEVVLALDCWEHAFMIDYGTKKAQYLDAFVKNVDWGKVNERFS